MTWHERIEQEFTANPNGFTEGEWAQKTGSVKLSTRIGEMEGKGYEFSRTWIPTLNTEVIRYRLVSKPVQYAVEKNGQYAIV